NPGQWDARLPPPLHLDERELHVDGRRQLGLRAPQLFEFRDLARLRADRTGRPIGHAGDCVTSGALDRARVLPISVRLPVDTRRRTRYNRATFGTSRQILGRIT